MSTMVIHFASAVAQDLLIRGYDLAAIMRAGGLEGLANETKISFGRNWNAYLSFNSLNSPRANVGFFRKYINAPIKSCTRHFDLLTGQP